MTRVTRALVGLLGGLVMLAAGVWLVFGPGWALIVAGVVTILSCLLAYNVDEPPTQEVNR